MPETLRITINRQTHNVAEGTSVAVAVLMAGLATRRSVSGEVRGPVCGMGVCMECRLTIDGRRDVRSCQVMCADGMEITTNV
jgi:predicted molibdopterin-dependent oxidoreductase YjgC